MLLVGLLIIRTTGPFLPSIHNLAVENAERALLVGVEVGSSSQFSTEESLAELAALARNAGAEVAGEVRQRLKEIDPRTFIGRGKVEQLGRLARDRRATLAIFDDSLAPAQARNIENEIDLRVIDRSQIILDIFAQRARTLAGKLQVEVAQLSYLLPRLTRRWTHLSRLAGGGASGGGKIGTRGPGETQLEMDRRRLRERLVRLRKRLGEVERTRTIQRRRRLDVPYPMVALVGYTNSGKSTLMNALTGAGVEVADRPFSTLDPTIRRLKLPGGMHVMVSDTVGFIHRLPHMLVEAFKASLEEVRTATLLLHVADSSTPFASQQIDVVDRVLREIGASAIPRVLVMNKIDLSGHHPRPGHGLDTLPISALTGEGLDLLLESIGRFFTELREEIQLVLPATRGDLIAMARRDGHVLSEEYKDGRVRMHALVTTPMAGRLRKAARAVSG